jgi:hypothetical protein
VNRRMSRRESENSRLSVKHHSPVNPMVTHPIDTTKARENCEVTYF